MLVSIRLASDLERSILQPCQLTRCFRNSLKDSRVLSATSHIKYRIWRSVWLCGLYGLWSHCKFRERLLAGRPYAQGITAAKLVGNVRTHSQQNMRSCLQADVQLLCFADCLMLGITKQCGQAKVDQGCLQLAIWPFCSRRLT